MVEIIPEHGILAFFDILGYRNLILNNKIENTASIVLKIIEKLPSFVESYVLQAVERVDAKEIARNILSQISWKIFSDTIFTCLPIEEKGIRTLDVMKWGIFLASCLSLQRCSFDEGLPLRGAVSIGKYYLKDYCFVGKPVIDAYDLCQQQDWSGGVLSENAGNEFKHTFEETPAKNATYNIDKFLSIYPVPMKHGKSVELLCLRWGGARGLLSIPPLFLYKGDEGLEEYVTGNFKAHSKGLPRNVQSKVINTKKFLNFLKITYEP